ncbi:hypothetical protein SAMN06297144_0700 [Sphingomonas guangdongensis]|uniref:Invasion protein IalB, involved in pathogenesis n=1 Tax=Sphingomonas guangdongensis TaxID=1141890 RepID=A0A285QD22_9SPHN|nr:invasion associated locus B family protein [Sphingomonas guangdongensis]SOB79726.1 hypothetical protein SAMN06297144_0700 [Sphingomonas guangdongensis]
MSLALALLLQAAQGREVIGVHAGWGAFRDRAPQRCYALAAPSTRGGDAAAFASVATWPGTGARNQLHVRLSRERSARARVTLSVGERRFELLAGPRDAWSPDARTDRAIVAALRGGRSMSVESVDARGRPFADTYRLTGAATAIDAAAIRCAGG